jgi:ABC-2 type transport system permease protein
MRKIWAVVRREFLERVRTRRFVIGTLLGPVLFGLMFTLPVLFLRSTSPRSIAIVDATSGGLGARIEADLAGAMLDRERSIPRYYVTRLETTGDVDRVRDSLVRLVDRRDGEGRRLDGVLILTDGAVTADTVRYLGANASSPGDMEALERLLRQATLREKLARSGVDPAVMGSIARPLQMSRTKVAQGQETGQTGEASFLLAYFMSFVLYMALLLYGMQVLTSTIEEKTSRINEILVSSLSPFQLLLGKVVGVGSVGLLQLSIWSGAAFLLASQRGRIAGAMGADPAAVAALPIPELPAGLLVVLLVFFVLGFFFYSAGYAAVGSSCNTVQESQQAAMPFTMLVVVGLLLVFRLLGDPNSDLARIMTYVPPFAPFVTPVRHSLSPLPWPELLGSIAAMTLGVVAMTWVAGRIYRVGILMYGKRASVLELWRWIRVR